LKQLAIVSADYQAVQSYRMISLALLSLLFLVNGVVGQSETQACTNAGRALAANQPCLDAVINLAQYFDNDQFRASASELQDYCTPTCRSLNIRVATACGVCHTH